MNVCIPVYNGVDLLDVAAPHEVFKWLDEPVNVQLVAASEAPVATRDGFRFLPTHRFSDATDADVLWVPGGDPSVLAPMMRDEAPESIISFLRDFEARTTWVCSVCEGALLLAAAGLLDGYRATTHWAFVPCLQQFDKVTVVEGFPRFHQDRNRMTGGGISSALDEALQLVRILRGDEAARDIQRTIQYYPEPPFPSDLQVPAKCMFS